jgi:hypothetical protein
MECERVREDFVERLTGTLDAERSRTIDQHLAGCASCRAETERMREMWAELATLRVPAPGGAGGRVARLIGARASSESRAAASRPSRVPRVLASTGALAAALVVGALAGRQSAHRPGEPVAIRPNADAVQPKERYVLLLHGPARTAPLTPAQAAADSAAEQAIVSEYRAWAMRLRDSGALVMAEKLADDPLTMLTAAGTTQMPRNTPEELGGFFLIQADSAEAFRIARECPHPRHAGTVQVRRIQPT